MALQATAQPHTYIAPQGLLDNKVVLITGAGDGIGKTAALTYAELGATVILLGRTQKKLEAVYDAIEKADGAQPVLVPMDLETAEDSEYHYLAEQVQETFGRLDGLLHNAGLLGSLTPLAYYNTETFNKVMQVNVNSAFQLTKILLPSLQAAPDASIIFTTSSVGRKARANWGAYAISKFAVEGLMQTLADELENTSNIRVNCINPGATRTAMRGDAYPAEDPASICPPEDIMSLYTFLMGKDSMGINGASMDAQPK